MVEGLGVETMGAASSSEFIIEGKCWPWMEPRGDCARTASGRHWVAFGHRHSVNFAAEL